jgi:hypothetical protein
MQDSVGPAIRRVGAQVFDIAQQEQEKANATQLLEADREFAALEQNLFHDPKNGAFAKKGKDALSAPDSIWPTWDGAVEERINQMPPAIRGRAQAFAQNRRQALEQSLSRHIVNESDKYRQSEFNAYVESAAEAAASKYTDDQAIQTEVDRATIAMEATGITSGLPPEAVDQLRAGITSKILSSAMREKLRDDPVSAQAWYDKNKLGFDADSRETFEKQLKPLVLAEESREEAQRLMKGTDHLGAMEKALDIKDPAKRKAVVDEIQMRKTLFDAQEREYKENMIEGLNQAVEGSDPAQPLDRSLSSAQYDFAVREGLMPKLRSLQEERITGAVPKTDPVRFGEIVDLVTAASGGDKAASAKLIELNPMLEGSLAPSDRAKVSEWRKTFIESSIDPEAERKLRETMSESQQLSDAYITAGIKKDSEEALYLRNLYTDTVESFKVQQGRAPYGDERDKMLKNILLNYDRGWTKTDGRLFEVWAGMSNSEKADALIKLRGIRGLDYQASPVEIAATFAEMNNYEIEE